MLNDNQEKDSTDVAYDLHEISNRTQHEYMPNILMFVVLWFSPIVLNLCLNLKPSFWKSLVYVQHHGKQFSYKNILKKII